MPSTDGTTDELDELEALRARVEALERERVEEAARANAAIAAAQDRSYWLDRWHVDLNALMDRPAGNRIRAALRAGRSAGRSAKRLRARLPG